MEIEIPIQYLEQIEEAERQITAVMEPYLSSIAEISQTISMMTGSMNSAIPSTESLFTNITMIQDNGPFLIPEPLLLSAFAIQQRKEAPINYDLLADKIVERMKPQRGHRNRATYPLPRDAKLSKLRFKQVDGHTVKVKYPGLPTEVFDYKDLGMENRKSHGPDVQWNFFCTLFGTNRISASSFDSRFNRNVKLKVNKCLQKFFETSEDFFYPYDHRDHEWQAKPVFISEANLDQFEE